LHASYFERIARGPGGFAPAQAARAGVALDAAALDAVTSRLRRASAADDTGAA